MLRSIVRFVLVGYLTGWWSGRVTGGAAGWTGGGVIRYMLAGCKHTCARGRLAGWVSGLDFS